MMKKNDVSVFGPPLTALELWRFLEQHTENNLRLEALGKPVTPLCIWGEHGIGKTQIVEQFAAERGMAFSYLAPAQFEEMGDLAGLPELVDGKTVFQPAAWVPREEGPGILLIDDFNRADERILRGLMQLLQGYGLAGWKLPPRWQIVLTANPDRGDYSVTPLDDAMLTRMLHVALRFRLEDWLLWAEREGLDARARRFMALYDLHLPAGAGGRLKGRTTARSLTQFFRAIEAIENWPEQLDQIAIYAQAALETETADAFVEFVRQKAWEWPSPEEWLRKGGQPLPEDTPAGFLQGWHRILLRYLQERGQPLGKEEKETLKNWLLSESLNKEQRLLLIRELRNLGRSDLHKLLDSPEVLEAML